MDLGIAGKIALVTASSKGLGRGVAFALAREGCKVVITARGKDALQQTAAELRDEGCDVYPVAADVTEPRTPHRLIDAAIEHYGRLNILVPNAGGPPPGKALDVTEEETATALNANFLTSVRLIQQAVPHMRRARWGRICAITSSSIKEPIDNLALSNSSRAALWAWAKPAARDLFTDGITLNLACPGAHATDRMKQLGLSEPMGDPMDFGSAVAFLCSQPAQFINGTALVIDGGKMRSL